MSASCWIVNWCSGLCRLTTMKTANWPTVDTIGRPPRSGNFDRSASPSGRPGIGDQTSTSMRFAARWPRHCAVPAKRPHRTAGRRAERLRRCVLGRVARPASVDQHRLLAERRRAEQIFKRQCGRKQPRPHWWGRRPFACRCAPGRPHCCAHTAAVRGSPPRVSSEVGYCESHLRTAPFTSSPRFRATSSLFMTSVSSARSRAASRRHRLHERWLEWPRGGGVRWERLGRQDPHDRQRA